MHRRTVLTAVGIATVAGCLDEPSTSEPTDDHQSDDGDETHDDEAQDDHDETRADDDSDENGDETDDDETDGDDDGEPDPTLEIADDVLEAPQDETTATLTNDGDDTLYYNPYRWRLEKRVDGTWQHVAPMGETPEPERGLEPGETSDRTITVDHDATNHHALGPGEYQFSIARATTQFEVTGPELEIEADDVDERDEEGGVPVVITSAATDALEDETEPDRVVFERTDEDGRRSLLPEHVVQHQPLRNALPIMREEDLEELILYTGRFVGEELLHTVLSGYDEGDPITYDGWSFSLRLEEYDGELD